MRAKGQDLIAKAVAVMKEFGYYFKFCKNCQDFCNKYLEAIGLGEAKTFTDDEEAAILTAVAVIIVSLFAMLK